MDFKSFHNNRQRQATDNSSLDEKDLRKTAQEYGKKSDAELLSDIMRAAGEGRKNGTLSDQALDEFAANLSPMLNAEQKARLQSVLKIIKGN